MTNFFKFKNIQLERATHQNIVITIEGTLEEQFQTIQRDSRQKSLDELCEQTQPTAPEQLQDITLTSQAPHEETRPQTPAVSSNPSIIKIIDTNDIYDATHTVPREPKQRLTLLDSSDLLGLLTDDESDNDIPPLIKTGMSQCNTQLKVTADIHNTVKVQKTMLSIEADPELMDDEEDDYIIN